MGQYTHFKEHHIIIILKTLTNFYSSASVSNKFNGPVNWIPQNLSDTCFKKYCPIPTKYRPYQMQVLKNKQVADKC